MAQVINEALRLGVDTGIPATDVAAPVVAAIKARQFWILTHEDSRPGPVERMRRAAADINPTLTRPAIDRQLGTLRSPAGDMKIEVRWDPRT